MCEWKNKAIQLVSAKEAKQKFPLLVVGFLEAKIVAPRYDFASAEIKNITRSFRALIEENGVSIEAKIQIERNMALEKSMLRMPSKVIDRRATIAAPIPLRKAPITLRRVTDVPFGARGRKRTTIPVVEPSYDADDIVTFGRGGTRTYKNDDFE